MRRHQADSERKITNFQSCLLRNEEVRGTKSREISDAIEMRVEFHGKWRKSDKS